MSSSREVPGPIAREIVTNDAERSDTVVKPIEMRRLQLVQTLGDDATESAKDARERPMRSEHEAVHDDVAPAKRGGVGDHLLRRESHAGEESRDDGACARANDDIGRDPVLHEPIEHAEVCRAAHASRAENDTDTDRILVRGHPITRRLAPGKLRRVPLWGRDHT